MEINVKSTHQTDKNQQSTPYRERVLINMSKYTNSIDRVGIHSIQSETVTVRIVWWPVINSMGNVQWSIAPPHCRELSCDVLGVWSSRKVKFNVHAVLPSEPLPPMNRSSRPLFTKAVRQAVADKLGVNVDGCNSDVIDWEGSDAE